MKFKVMLIALLAVGILSMHLLLILRRSRYQLKKEKQILLLLILFFSGYFGTKLLFWIENGYYDGQSYYGAIFFVPIVFLFVSAYFDMGYGKLLSYVAPTGCIIHIIMKIGCLLSGCCSGNELYNSICFVPLQAVEALVSLMIIVYLVLIESNENSKNSLYGWYMVLQGVTRFFLNSFRRDLSIFLLLPAGHLWSLLCAILGLIYLRYYNHINIVADRIGQKSKSVLSVFVNKR